ncbi:CBO0543 family protein [Cohnella caldifontis]|uniref:CBO0543 family protein n=1 Tax=Cohnella caldifontis TaxID=3027471 RepID=UPI0023EBED28|nr:CBO0543 family protein [Cohnella sp. YIM B05605]
MVFLAASLVILYAFAFWMPKRMTGFELHYTSLFALVLELITDIWLNLQLDLYRYFGQGIENKGYLVILLFPVSNMIYLNFYPYGKAIRYHVLYIGAATAASLVYEWLAIQSGFFSYHGWKLWYSAVCYPVILVILAAHFAHTRRIRKAS